MKTTTTSAMENKTNQHHPKNKIMGNITKKYSSHKRARDRKGHSNDALSATGTTEIAPSSSSTSTTSHSQSVQPTSPSTTTTTTTEVIENRSNNKNRLFRDNDYDAKETRAPKVAKIEIEASSLNTTTTTFSGPQNDPHPRERVFVHDNILTVDECNELIAVHRSEHHAGYIDNLTITRFADLASKDKIHLTLPMVRARHKCWDQIEHYFDEQFELYPEFTSLMGWQEGSYLKSHYDANREYLLDRHCSAVLYLNDQSGHTDDCNVIDRFVGGDLVFEFVDESSANPKSSSTSSPSFFREEQDTSHAIRSKEMRIRPKTGRLVCFPSTSKYIHRVDEITKGCRYALTMWFTKNIDAMETLDSCQRVLYINKNDTDSDTDDKATEQLQSLIEQPWESKEKAQEILEIYMRNANLVPHPTCIDQWTIPSEYNFKDSSSVESGGVEQDNPRMVLSSMSQGDVRHLIAYCWWKKKTPLGDVALSSSATNDDFPVLYRMWEQYKAIRVQGLKSASRRWKANGMITNVTDEEMKLR